MRHALAGREFGDANDADAAAVVVGKHGAVDWRRTQMRKRQEKVERGLCDAVIVVTGNSNPPRISDPWPHLERQFERRRAWPTD